MVECLIPEPVADVTRRRFLGGAAAAGLSLGLAACGGSGSGSSSTATSSAPADRVVSTAMGDVRVPANPKRVIAINDYPLDTMFDLGMEPIGIYSAGEEYVPPVYIKQWKGLPTINDVGVAGAVNVEKIASLNPDLIIGIDAQKAPYDQLKQVAPTVLLPFNQAKGAWQPLSKDAANALNKNEELRALDAKFKQRGAKVRQDHAATLKGQKFDLIQGGFDQGQYWLYGPTSNIATALAPAGLEYASASADTKEQRSVSYERVDLLKDADILFYYTTNDGKPANLGPKLFGLEVFQRLPAVKADRLIGSVNFLTTSYGTAMAALDDLDAGLKRLSA
jgi:iron complex transport system substrate-binding protein